MRNPQQLTQKFWSYCNIFRDDGLSYGGYVEQLSFLLFLKMALEPLPIPKSANWPALLTKDGDELKIQYRHAFEEPGKRSGLLGINFRKAQNTIQDPAKLRRLIVDLLAKDKFATIANELKK